MKNLENGHPVGGFHGEYFNNSKTEEENSGDLDDFEFLSTDELKLLSDSERNNYYIEEAKKIAQDENRNIEKNNEEGQLREGEEYQKQLENLYKKDYSRNNSEKYHQGQN